MAVWHLEPGGEPRTFRSLPSGDAAVLESLLSLLGAAGAGAQGWFAWLDGRRIHYLTAGSGPPLLLLHGGGGGCGNWYSLIPGLSRHFRVIAPDLPGFALSEPGEPDPPLGRSSARRIELLLDQVLGPGEADSTALAVMGTSFGGLVALRLAQRERRRLSAVVLADSAGLGGGIAWPVRAGGIPLLGPLLRRGGRRGSRWIFRHLMVSDPDRIPDRVRAPLMEYLFRTARARGDATLARTLRHFVSLRSQREVLSARELAELELPMLVVWGQEDRLLPLEDARRAAAVLPRARLEVMPSCGHSPNWEAPEALLDSVLGFLRGSAGLMADAPGP